MLYRAGDSTSEFLVIQHGLVVVQDEDDRVVGVHGPGQFLGELSLLTGGPSLVSAVVAEAGSVLAVPVDQVHDLVARDPAFGDLILRAYLQRRSILIGLGTGPRIIGSRFSADTRRLRDFVSRNRVPHRFIDLDQDAEAETLVRTLGIPPDQLPVRDLGRPNGTAQSQQRRAGAAARAALAQTGPRLRRPAGDRGRTGRVGRGRLRRLGGTVHSGLGSSRHRRAGRHLHPDRELPGLSGRHLRSRAGRASPGAGRPVRRRHHRPGNGHEPRRLARKLRRRHRRR